MREPRALQFSLAQVLALTTGAAIALAIGRVLFVFPLPVLAGVYLAAFGTYGVLRGPRLWHEWQRLRERRRQVESRRRQAIAETRARQS
ncbi:MAG: hypothetical protein KDJ41_08700 [Hyphomicrobiaceae bacterium]|nr:hypothetical protein [Hyphomicrobiaceae bacterium]